MSIPLDRLYHFIEDIAKEINDNIIIYRFYPHGEKNRDNLQELNGPILWKERALSIPVYCHDQEPLDYELYQNITKNYKLRNILKSLSMELSMYSDRNLMHQPTIYNKTCLLHSEKRSTNLTTYQTNECVDVYYWSHALMALDWFRFAEHTTQKKQVDKLFLIYNRAWCGTREYRLKFLDLLVELGLENYCQTSVNPVEPDLGIHYKIHKFKNPRWCPIVSLENFFPINTAQSHYSADFDLNDYESTNIEVVLETLFDDSRLHLTEKSLRPIACGQPFIIAGTYGSLEYLRSYGFKTFGNIWDESYDTIENSEERLFAITNLMKTISQWTPEEKITKLINAQEIANYNRRHFFNKDFINQITAELKTNLISGLNQLLDEIDTAPFVTRWEKLLTYKEINSYLKSESDLRSPTLSQVTAILQIAKSLQKNCIN